MKSNLLKVGDKLRNAISGTATKVGTGLTALAVSGQVFAGGGGTPGSAVVAELSGGKADMLLIIGAIAIFIGVLVVWAYTRKAATK